MDEKLLSKLLHERQEKDWLEFKSKFKLYTSDGILVEQQKDELIKDILGLANGNSHIIRKTKYLIIGADNIEFDKDGCRILHDVDYKVPSTSDITKWLVSASGSAVVGLESEIVCLHGKNIWVINIPPTFEIHETVRRLDASKSFQQHTVFMRQDENTVPASVRDGIAIQQLKYLHRQEISNPPAVWIGLLAGGTAAFITVDAYMRSTNLSATYSDTFIRMAYTFFGAFCGTSIGWFVKQGNEIRYNWRYLTLRKRIIMVCFILFMIISYFIIFR